MDTSDSKVANWGSYYDTVINNSNVVVGADVDWMHTRGPQSWRCWVEAGFIVSTELRRRNTHIPAIGAVWLLPDNRNRRSPCIRRTCTDADWKTRRAAADPPYNAGKWVVQGPNAAVLRTGLVWRRTRTYHNELPIYDRIVLRTTANAVWRSRASQQSCMSTVCNVVNLTP